VRIGFDVGLCDSIARRDAGELLIDGLRGVVSEREHGIATLYVCSWRMVSFGTTAEQNWTVVLVTDAKVDP
jgi:hypothetical protein